MNSFWNFDPLQHRQKLARITLLGIILLAFSLRTYNLTVSPPGFYLDETSNGYNAYSILKTGGDEYGVKWPLFIRAFDDYRGGVFIYSLIPLIAGKGLNIETVRLGAGLWGTLTVLLLFWLAKLISDNITYSLLAAMILTLMPWHIHFSRIAYEAIVLPAAMIVIIGCWLKWLKTKKFSWGLGLTLVFWTSIFTYQTAKFWIPLLSVIIIIIYKGLRKNNWHKLWPWLIGGGLILLSLWLWEKSFPGSLLTRTNQLAIWRDQPMFWETIRRFSNNFISHWSWQFLFNVGDLTYRSSSKVSSEMLASWAGFLIIGLVIIVTNLRKKPIWLVGGCLIVLFPLAASLTITSPHAIRTIQAAPFFALAIALGMWWFLKKLKNKKLWLILFIVLSTGVIGVEFRHYYIDLIDEYPRRVWMPQHGFDGDLPKTITQAYGKSIKENKALFLSDKIERVYIQGLFFTKADPRLWQTKRQAPFTVAEFKDAQPNQVWVITRDECPQKDQNYCVLTD